MTRCRRCVTLQQQLDMTAVIASSANDTLYSNPMLLEHAKDSFDGLSIAVGAVHYVAILDILDC